MVPLDPFRFQLMRSMVDSTPLFHESSFEIQFLLSSSSYVRQLCSSICIIVEYIHRMAYLSNMPYSLLVSCPYDDNDAFQAFPNGKKKRRKKKRKERKKKKKKGLTMNNIDPFLLVHRSISQMFRSYTVCQNTRNLFLDELLLVFSGLECFQDTTTAC